MAAHAACADAALTDDAHWDAISQTGGAPEDETSATEARRSGCLGSVGLLLLLLALVIGLMLLAG